MNLYGLVTIVQPRKPDEKGTVQSNDLASTMGAYRFADVALGTPAYSALPTFSYKLGRQNSDGSPVPTGMFFPIMIHSLTPTVPSVLP